MKKFLARLVVVIMYAVMMIVLVIIASTIAIPAYLLFNKTLVFDWMDYSFGIINKFEYDSGL